MTGTRSLMATTSMSGARSSSALSDWRPTRPKPLMPTRVVMVLSISFVADQTPGPDRNLARTVPGAHSPGPFAGQIDRVRRRGSTGAVLLGCELARCGMAG